MTETDRGYKFQSTGRELITYGSDLISISHNGIIYSGYDQQADLEPDYEYDGLTDEEKKELSRYMILKWAEWAGIRESYL